MLQLIYTSAATGPLEQGLIDQICDQARQNNSRDEITGVLITKGNRFLQVLEGPKVPVEDAFVRIIADSRHHRLELLGRRLIGRREFGEWDMRYCPSYEACLDIFDRLRSMLNDSSQAAWRAYTDFVTSA